MNYKKAIKQIILAPLFLLVVTPFSAQISTQNLSGKNINTITTAVPFLLISPDSRSGAMGDVGVAIKPDANSTYWNPAKLAFIDDSKDMGFSMSYSPWLRALVNDINLAYLTGYKKLDRNSAIGVSLRYFSLGNITFTDNFGTTIRDFKPNEFSLDVCYSRKLSSSNLIKKELLNLTPLGVIGFHPSLLPQNKGRHPLIWAKALGLKKSGTTFVRPKAGLKNSFTYMKTLFNDVSKGTGSTVISAAGGYEFALESEDWNNGVFTYAVLEGLSSGDADRNRDGFVHVSELKDYVTLKVVELTDGKQHPTTRSENALNDFILFKVDRQMPVKVINQD